MKVIIATITKRSYGLELLRKSLLQQTYKDFDWLVCSEEPYFQSSHWIPKVPPKPTDYWNHYKSINAGFRFAKEYDLYISTADLVFLSPDTIEKLIHYYTQDKKLCISMIGDHYRILHNGFLEEKCWTDPRRGQMRFPFEQSTITNFDLCVSSFPVEGIYAVGGIDEEFDKYGVGDKEMVYRMMKIGYTIYITQEITFKRLCHAYEQSPTNRAELFEKGEKYFSQCIKEIDNNTRLRLNYL